MYSRILFRSAIDVCQPFDFNQSSATAMNKLGNNSGNLVFTTAIQKYLSNQNCRFDICDKDPIDAGYDACVINCSNWISKSNKELLKTLVWRINGMNIPCFFIGLGAQSSSGGDFGFLDTIKDETSRLIEAVYKTGGAFGLRGDFTASVFDRLGFSDYTVIGCPSLYQMGRELKIANQKVSIEEFKPVINGDFYLKNKSFSDVFMRFPHSEFVCQDSFYRYLYRPDEITSADKRALLLYPDQSLRLLLDGRLKLFCGLAEWLDYFRMKNFNFCFGTRVHGSLVALLVGTPALIQTCDSRTAEICEFFNIPSDVKAVSNWQDLYNKYLEVDYTKFNDSFPFLYDRFCQFLSDKKLPMIVGKNDEFENKIANSSLFLALNEKGFLSSELADFIEDYIKYMPQNTLMNVKKDKRFWFLVLKKFFPLVSDRIFGID